MHNDLAELVNKITVTRNAMARTGTQDQGGALRLMTCRLSQPNL